MKTICVSLILLVINFFSVCGIVTLGLQDHLTMLIYIVPILLEFFWLCCGLEKIT